MTTQAPATQRKTRWSTPSARPSPAPQPQLYPRRRPESTTLHRIVREPLETFLGLANESDPMGDGVPDHVEKEFRSYLKCGSLAHGFARARCSRCGYDFPCALRATLVEACPTAPTSASVGAVSFLHRFGSSLDPHFHFHLCVVDGLFQRVEDDTDEDPANPESRLHSHEATTLTSQFLENVQHTLRKRVLRPFRRQGLLEPHEAEDMLAWDHGGGAAWTPVSASEPPTAPAWSASSATALGRPIRHTSLLLWRRRASPRYSRRFPVRT